MTPKIQLPKRFELRGDIYTLAYFPGDESAIEPNFASMKPLQSGLAEVRILQGKKFMTWCIAEVPAKIGTNVPAKRFLLFYLSDRAIAPELCPMANMIAYMVHPESQAMSMEQQFINLILGMQEEAVAPPQHDDWAAKLFSASTTDEELEELTAPVAVESE